MPLGPLLLLLRTLAVTSNDNDDDDDDWMQKLVEVAENSYANYNASQPLPVSNI